jgi:hypothetical protein
MHSLPTKVVINARTTQCLKFSPVKLRFPLLYKYERSVKSSIGS